MCSGRCFHFFFLAVIFDVAGLIIFFLGIFAHFSFSDFFVQSGPIIIFLSLVFWIFWYLGNISKYMYGQKKRTFRLFYSLGKLYLHPEN
uniref:Transmembrane protein 238-like n=1 Tax=Scleropages formosus TaxID=113540 RepID=A0A8C9SFM6_SCLFO